MSDTITFSETTRHDGEIITTFSLSTPSCEGPVFSLIKRYIDSESELCFAEQLSHGGWEHRSRLFVVGELQQFYEGGGEISLPLRVEKFLSS